MNNKLKLLYSKQSLDTCTCLLDIVYIIQLSVYNDFLTWQQTWQILWINLFLVQAIIDNLTSQNAIELISVLDISVTGK